MASLGFMAGFEAVLVLKRGLEGTLATSLTKSTGLYCSLKKPDGSIKEYIIDGGADEFEPYKMNEELPIENLTLESNLILIEDYMKNGTSENQEFNKRVDFTFKLISKGLEWVNVNSH